MKALLIAVLLLTSIQSFADCNKAYFKVGTSYKFMEAEAVTFHGVDQEIRAGSKYGARFELAVDCTNLTYGIAHHSQWLDGAPFNHNKEYSKTEFFIDYKFEWNI